MIYTRPAGGLSPAGYFFSVTLMYSRSINFTCLLKSLPPFLDISIILSCRSFSNRTVFFIFSSCRLFIFSHLPLLYLTKSDFISQNQLTDLIGYYKIYLVG